MKATLIVVGIIVVILAVLFAAGSNGLSDIKKMTINQVDLSKVSDGVYKGKFHKARWNYDVEVEVKDHKITSIKTTNKIPDQKLIDEAIKRIEAKQSVDIDVVSGATVNTKAFRKAVENALTQGTGN